MRLNLHQIFMSGEIFAVAVFFISFFGLITSRRIIKAVVSVVIMEISVIMFFLSIGYQQGVIAPIGESSEIVANAADPLTQALVITAIVIGAAITAVNLTILITICRKHKTTDWDNLRKRYME